MIRRLTLISIVRLIINQFNCYSDNQPTTRNLNNSYLSWRIDVRTSRQQGRLSFDIFRVSRARERPEGHGEGGGRGPGGASHLHCGAAGEPEQWKWMFCHLPSFRRQTRVSSD